MVAVRERVAVAVRERVSVDVGVPTARERVAVIVGDGVPRARERVAVSVGDGVPRARVRVAVTVGLRDSAARDRVAVAVAVGAIPGRDRVVVAVAVGSTPARERVPVGDIALTDGVRVPRVIWEVVAAKKEANNTIRLSIVILSMSYTCFRTQKGLLSVFILFTTDGHPASTKRRTECIGTSRRRSWHLP